MATSSEQRSSSTREDTAAVVYGAKEYMQRFQSMVEDWMSKKSKKGSFLWQDVEDSGQGRTIRFALEFDGLNCFETLAYTRS